MLSVGIEPTSWVPQTHILSIELREQVRGRASRGLFIFKPYFETFAIAFARRDFLRSALPFLIVPRFAALSNALNAADKSETVAFSFLDTLLLTVFTVSFIVFKMRPFTSLFLSLTRSAFLADLVIAIYTYSNTFLWYNQLMIGYIRGTVCDIDEKSITLDVAGVGYEVLVPVNTLFNAKDGQELVLYIHTHVREDQITLFGFADKNDRALFKKLLSVSGVGPKTALNVLSVSAPSSIIRAIENGKSDLFPKVPGLGKKTIEKIILDLKGKFDANQIMQNETEDMHNARMALDTLGYNTRDINEVLTTLHPDLDMHSIIRESLKILSKSK